MGAFLVSAVVACTSDQNQVVVYTSVDQVFSEPIFRAFEQESGVKVRAVFDTEETKSTGVLNRLISEAGQPQADVFWSGDPVRPFLLLKQGLVEPYLSPNAREIPAGLRAPDGTWTGIAARARVLLVNTAEVGAGERPNSVLDLAHPRWRGQAAIANPLYGTTTMHVAALFAFMGEDKARAFLNALKANQVRIASSNGEVKRLVVSGEVAFGLTDTDDANEALKEGASVEVVYPDQDGMGTLVMPTSVVLMRGAPHPDAGRRLVDFLLSAEVERRMAELAAHMPLRPGVPTPSTVRPASAIRTMNVEFRRVAEELETIQPWLRQWAGL
jgi:iron(III) transport system substrate-binding protein